MKDSLNRYDIAGTSALKPDCSRYSNENERIIDFPGEGAYHERQIDYGKISRAQHVTAQTRVHARARRVLDESETISDFRQGSIRGTSFGGMKIWKMVAAGGVYSAIAIAALYIAAI